MDRVRRRAGNVLFARVAGPDGPRNRREIHTTPGPRWFPPDDPVRVVHADSAMFVGGLTALLLQSLHPAAMAAVAAHSGYRGDPWGRLHRTSTFLARTTYGTAASAQAACDRLNAMHTAISGVSAQGIAYRASDPHLLKWVHMAEADSFLRAHQRFGARTLSAEEADGYVRGMARIARALGVTDPPRTVEELQAGLRSYRTELRCTPEARECTRYLLFRPPLPLPAWPLYAVLAANAVSLLPPWAAAELHLGRCARAERWAVRPAGGAVTGLIRWALRDAPPTADA
ncbi:oxygenase MpaB family protein [Streptomyces flavofungini]|uniref:oxygenase MpaB family protein n=1 Tax=Streptomyces flavofungini TaxID=68200 RepID=UPI0034DE855D